MSTARYALQTFIKTKHLQQLMCYMILAFEGHIPSCAMPFAYALSFERCDTNSLKDRGLNSQRFESIPDSFPSKLAFNRHIFGSASTFGMC